MTEAEAREYIVVYTDANVDPVLTTADIEMLLSRSMRMDRYRVLPTDANWTGTYDVNNAVASGWLLKAARLTNMYNFMVHGKMLSRQQMWDHCMAMHQTFRKKAGLNAVRMGEPTNTIDEVEVANLNY